MKTIATHKLTEQVHTPDYDRGRLKTKMVHLGFGAFHRGHQALYTDELASKAGSVCTSRRAADREQPAQRQLELRSSLSRELRCAAGSPL